MWPFGPTISIVSRLAGWLCVRPSTYKFPPHSVSCQRREVSVWNIHVTHYGAQVNTHRTDLSVVSAACFQVKLVVAGVWGQESAQVVRHVLCVRFICRGANPPSETTGGSCGRCVSLIPPGVVVVLCVEGSLLPGCGARVPLPVALMRVLS